MITSADEFYSLRKSNNPNDYARAANEDISFDTCFEIISKYPDMKKWVIHNKKVPLEILRLFLNDPDDDLRLTLAMKRKLDESIFSVLSEDENFSIRLAIVRNPKVPIHILQKLVDDKEEYIALEAKKKLSERII